MDIRVSETIEGGRGLRALRSLLAKPFPRERRHVHELSTTLDYLRDT